FGQTREQQDIRSSAVKAALFPEYEAYVDTVYRDTPDTFEGLVKAILNWPLLGGHNPKRDTASSSGRDFTRGKGPVSVQAHIDNVRYAPDKIVLTVNKKLSGIFHQGGSGRTGSVEGFTVSRHLWMNTGSGWRLMATSQDEGWIRLNGKAFTSLPRGFDPNQA